MVVRSVLIHIACPGPPGVYGIGAANTRRCAHPNGPVAAIVTVSTSADNDGSSEIESIGPAHTKPPGSRYK